MSRPLRIGHSDRRLRAMNRGRRGEVIFPDQKDYQCLVELLQEDSTMRNGEYEVTAEIEKGVVCGRFLRRALSLALDRCLLNKRELLVDWELAGRRLLLNPIPPLE